AGIEHDPDDLTLSLVLDDQPASDLVRVIVRGTGPTPVFGEHPRVPLAGLVGGPAGSEDDGHDAVLTLRIGPAARAPAAAVDLPGPGETLVWRIDLGGKDEPFGYENSYGDICADPCEPATGTAPFVAEAVGVVLTPIPVPGGLDPGASAFRNRVASWYFEQ